MSRTYWVDGIEMTGRELVEFALQQYGCQLAESLKFTSVAAEELRRHGITVEEALAEAEEK